MLEFLSTWHPGQVVGLLAVAGGVLVTLTAIICGIWGSAWASVRHAELKAALKRDMLQKGLSAEDIERVLTAGQGTPAASSSGSSGGRNVPPPKYVAVTELVSQMAEYSFTDAAPVLAALPKVAGYRNHPPCVPDDLAEMIVELASATPPCTGEQIVRVLLALPAAGDGRAEAAARPVPVSQVVSNLLEHGYDGEQVAQIVSLLPRTQGYTPADGGAVSGNVAAMIESLAEHGTDSDEIETVLRQLPAREDAGIHLEMHA